MNSITNNRLKNLSRSEIRIMSVECEKVKGINLSQGICDIPISNILETATTGAITSGYNQYSSHDGLPQLKNAISKKLSHYNHIEVNANSQVIVTSGATGAFYSACLGLLEPGDEVLLFEPFYGYHEYTLLALDLIPIYVSLTPPLWTYDIEEIEQKITPRTKGIVINTPANPSGKIFSYEELDCLANLCIKHNLLVFTDEIYEYIKYDGHQHVSPGSLEKLKDRVITISGYSKTFSITGWRIGYCACPEKYSEEIGCASDLVYACAPTPLQLGVSKAITELSDEFYEALRKSYEIKRNMVVKVLEEIGLQPYIPQGAYYILADVSKVPGNTSKEKAMYVLDQTGVAVVPGSSFYHDNKGEHIIRLCFAKDDSILEEACDRLRKLK